jgi:hypothetical protein
MHNRIWSAVCAVILLASCSDEKEPSRDLTTEVNTAGSIESSVEITHLDSTRDVLTTRHKVWIRGSVYKTVEYQDTLPALGRELAEAATEDGDSRVANRMKEYEVYITVK